MKKQKITTLNSLRSIACLDVFAFHAYLVYWGACSVTFFLMMSGFLMTYSALGREDTLPRGVLGCGKFALKKIKKLYPLYFITLLLLMLRIFLLMPDNPDMTQLGLYIKQFFCSIVLLQSWLFDRDMAFSLNAVGWYLSTSLFSYFIFPYVLRLVRKVKKMSTALLSAVGVYLSMILISVFLPQLCSLFTGKAPATYDDFQYCFCYFFPPFRSGDFIIGCFLGSAFALMDGRFLDTVKTTLLEVLGFALLIGSQVIFCRNILPGYLTCDIVYIPCSAILLYSFAYGKGRLSQALDCKLTRVIADYSVEIFLLHYTVIKYASPISNFLPVPFIFKQAAFLTLAIGGTFVSVVLYRRLSKRFPVLSLR